MSDSAHVFLPILRSERHRFGEVELPSLLKGQVRLLGIGDFRAVLQQLDLDVRRMEATHVTDQGVDLSKGARVAAVYLNLGRRRLGHYSPKTEQKDGAEKGLHCSDLEVKYNDFPQRNCLSPRNDTRRQRSARK